MSRLGNSRNRDPKHSPNCNPDQNTNLNPNPTLTQARDCYGIATQSNVCNGLYRVSHANQTTGVNVTLKEYANWRPFKLWAYTLDRDCLGTPTSPQSISDGDAAKHTVYEMASHTIGPPPPPSPSEGHEPFLCENGNCDQLTQRIHTQNHRSHHSLTRCKEECKSQASCTAVEWVDVSATRRRRGDPSKCKLMLGATAKVQSDGWEVYPNVCGSAENADLTETNHAAGDASLSKCKAECEMYGRCTAVEWYDPAHRGAQCKLLLGSTAATQGCTGGTRPGGATCYVRPIGPYMKLNTTNALCSDGAIYKSSACDLHCCKWACATTRSCTHFSWVDSGICYLSSAGCPSYLHGGSGTEEIYKKVDMCSEKAAAGVCRFRSVVSTTKHEVTVDKASEVWPVHLVQWTNSSTNRFITLILSSHYPYP